MPYKKAEFGDMGLSGDRKFLHLNYYSFKGFKGSSEEEYNKLFDELNLYDTLEEFYLVTNFIYSIPSHVLKFTKLKTLTIEGTRFWGLTMEQIPASVEVLDLTRQSNLTVNCIKGMERLVNLKKLYLDDIFGIITNRYYINNEPTIPLAYIPGLIVEFQTELYPYDKEDRVIVEKRLRDNKLFSGLNFELNDYGEDNEDDYIIRMRVKLV